MEASTLSINGVIQRNTLLRIPNTAGVRNLCAPARFRQNDIRIWED
jgi:hypothetical protein